MTKCAAAQRSARNVRIQKNHVIVTPNLEACSPEPAHVNSRFLAREELIGREVQICRQHPTPYICFLLRRVVMVLMVEMHPVRVLVNANGS
jgi:hypothetical protein